MGRPQTAVALGIAAAGFSKRALKHPLGPSSAPHRVAARYLHQSLLCLTGSDQRGVIHPGAVAAHDVTKDGLVGLQATAVHIQVCVLSV
jgi:hypothetical protein